MQLLHTIVFRQHLSLEELIQEQEAALEADDSLDLLEQLGATVDRTDPRSPAPSPEEVGRGPVPSSLGQFQSVELVGQDVVLTYRVADATIRELWKTSEHDGQIVIERHLAVSAHTKDLLLVVGARHQGPSQELETGVTVSGPAEPYSLSPWLGCTVQ